MSINMKHILRKLHIGGSLDGRGHHTGRVLEQQQQQDGGGGAGAPSSSSSHGISGWLRQGLHGGGGGGGTRSRLDSPRNNSAPDTPLPHPPSSSSALPIVEEEEDDNDTTMDFKFYEEEFQVQLALALSASNDDIRNDPDSVQIRATKRISLGRPPSPGNTPNEYFSHRYWAYNVLDYDEKVVDGFYDVYGVLSDFGASEKMPSLVDLQGAVVTDNLGYDVVLVKRTLDPELVQLEQAALRLSVDNESGDVGQQQISVIQKLANLVVGHMGGPVMDANLMLRKWQKRSYELRSSLNSIVLPLGCLRIGLSRHRALLFKVLADHARIACRLVKGSYYTGTDEGAVNIIKLDDEREYILDLMGAPGTLLPVEAGGSFHAAAENMYFPPQTEDRNSTQEKVADVSVLVKEDYAGQLDNRTCKYKEECLQSESMMDDIFGSFGSWPRGGSPDSGWNIVTENSQHTDIDERQIQGQTLTAHGMETLCTKDDNVLKDVAEWEIPWAEIVIGERIGLGSYGEVYHGDWHGKEVAVKKFLDQDLSGDALDEFRSEVRIMCRMQHPNVVLFMGAVTRPPNLSIITEYLPRGSLFRLIHRPNNGLDEACRLKMALDVAKGMNYLHTSSPTIVHRDLKSPNLLVDRDWLVKVCDFGLSRMKHHTFLSSKSTAGTPEWMAPEVLRNEPSNEKCDVYSFGVILWELATLQQPWGKMNPMQVVGAVGFQNRHLEIPEYVDPLVSRVIQECWRSEPGLRPSFAQIILALEPLQRLT